MMTSTKGRCIGAATATLALVATVGLANSVQADQPLDTTELQDAVTAAGVSSHLKAFQGFADQYHDNRAAGTPGHEKSADYVAETLDAAGYTISRQKFTYEQEKVILSEMAQTSPVVVPYARFDNFLEMSYSGSGDVTADVEAVDLSLDDPAASTSGCEAGDFEGFTRGNIALLQRGACSFALKAQNAEAAGASGVIIFNQGNGPAGSDRDVLFGGTLGEPGVNIPVVSASFPLGKDLAGTSGLEIRLNLEIELNDITTENILADSLTGRDDRIVVVGGHLDSVAEGPGINDNGSGTATILEVALQMKDMELENMVRFAFWSGEEDGLIGSDYYVSQLSARDIKNHAANLNFDMLGSPNYARFVYDGDGSAFGDQGPNGSARIEEIFEAHFADAGLAIEPTEFDGRSDYLAFIDAGIPAGGLFSGAEGENPVNGQAYDACYHQLCDNIENVSSQAIDEMSDAVAHATMTLAMTEAAVNGTSRGKAGQKGSTTSEYRGNLLQR